MYPIVLALHSWVRWRVVIAGLAAVAIILEAVPWPFAGVGEGRPWLRL